MKNKFGIGAMKNNHNNLFRKKNKNKKLKYNSKLYHFYLLRLRFIILQMDPQVQLKERQKAYKKYMMSFKELTIMMLSSCLFIDDEPLTFDKAYHKLNERKQ